MKKWGIIIGIVVAVAAIVLGIIFAVGPSKETTYREAVAALAAGQVDEAIEGFESLPKDYTLSDFNPTASEWLADIDTVYHCDFVGKWSNDAMSFEVIREIDSFGIRFKYQKTEGGQVVEGYVIRRKDDDNLADLQSDSAELHPDAIAGLCHLKLMPDGTMNLYVNGELQQTFSK